MSPVFARDGPVSIRSSHLTAPPLVTHTGRRVCIPHGGLRTLHQMSTYPDTINLRASCGADVVTSPPKFGGPETLIVNVVEDDGSTEQFGYQKFRDHSRAVKKDRSERCWFGCGKRREPSVTKQRATKFLSDPHHLFITSSMGHTL